jgi:L-iditol 2-dehydrogenase
MATDTRRAFVKAPYDFEIREDTLADPAAGELLIEVAACSICGTDVAIAGKTASDWQPLGHEIAGVVRAVGDGAGRFAVGDRVALDSSAPCGSCERCQAGRGIECGDTKSYWGGTMGFADFLLAREQVVFPAGNLPARHACLLEPTGVSIDMVDVAEVGAGDRVLIIGPGPLGLLAIPECRRRGAAYIGVAGRSHSQARLLAARQLGADEVILVDKTELTAHDFGRAGVNRVLVVAPPAMIPVAAEVSCRGSIISYIGIAWDATGTISLDADAFHFKRQQLRASMASPGTRGEAALALLSSGTFDPEIVLSHSFALADLPAMMATVRDDKAAAKKAVMVRETAAW